MTSTTSELASRVIAVARGLYGSRNDIPLHEPVLGDLEKKYVDAAIESTFVSSVGEFVDRFESEIAKFCGAKHSVVTVNGTAGLHAALHALGVGPGDEVITQPFTFVATGNAIRYCGAHPLFIDVDEDTLGLSPRALDAYLTTNASLRDGMAYNNETGRVIRACVPMHTFGLGARVAELRDICSRWKIWLVEDAAEALGSYVGEHHAGLLGEAGVLSFNGNKTITTGGGGAIITNNPNLAALLKHLTTTAKTPHAWDYYHDMLGFNYRLPNLNAALGCAQMERLPAILSSKRHVHDVWSTELADLLSTENHRSLLEERAGTHSNYWLNALVLADQEERDLFLNYTHESHVFTRPAWRLLTDLPEFADSQRGLLPASQDLVNRVVNLPSSPRTNP